MFWDIGANVGTHSIFASLKGVDVHSFEPHDGTRRRLQSNARLNNVDISIYPWALGELSSTRYLETGNEVGDGTHRVDDRGNQAVEVRRGDELDIPDPDVVKIDVEGGERKVIKGLANRLSTVRYLVVEVHPQFGISIASIRDQLHDHFENIEILELDRDEPFIIATRSD